MVTFREALEGGARVALCSIYDNLGNIADVFSDLLEPFPGAALYANFANQIRAVCNREPPPEPQPESAPFTGGQCPVLYRLSVTARPIDGTWFSFTTGRPEGVDPRTVEFDLWGPVSLVAVRSRTPVVGSNGDVFRGWNIDTRSHGSRATNPNAQRQPLPIIEQNDSNWVTRNNSDRLEVISVFVARVDGQPDSCGDPPPFDPYPPPAPNYNQRQLPITYDAPDGIRFTVPVIFIVGKAFLDANLNITIPINFSINNNITFPINFNFGNNTFNWNFFGRQPAPDGTPLPVPRPPGGGDRFPSDYNTDVLPPSPPPGDKFKDKDGPPDSQGRGTIRGVIVTASVRQPQRPTLLVQNGGNPDIYAPSLGWVSFQIQTGRTVAWTADIPVKNVRTFIPCPWEGGAVDVRGSPQPNVSIDLTPVYAKATLEVMNQ